MLLVTLRMDVSSDRASSFSGSVLSLSKRAVPPRREMRRLEKTSAAADSRGEDDAGAQEGSLTAHQSDKKQKRAHAVGYDQQGEGVAESHGAEKLSHIKKSDTSVMAVSKAATLWASSLPPQRRRG